MLVFQCGFDPDKHPCSLVSEVFRLSSRDAGLPGDRGDQRLLLLPRQHMGRVRYVNNKGAYQHGGCKA